MAAVVINPVKLKRNIASDAYATVAIDAVDGAIITVPKDTDKCLIVIESGTAGKTATIKGASNVMGSPDIEVAIGANERKAIVVESAGYVNAAGANKGKLVITGTDAAVKVACVVLP